jgi:hypothetical protein
MSQDEMRGTQLTPGAVDKGVFDSQMEGLRRGATSQPTILQVPSQGREVKVGRPPTLQRRDPNKPQPTDQGNLPEPQVTEPSHAGDGH